MNRIALALAAAVILGWSLAPLGWQALTSVTPEHALTRAALPEAPTLAHYRAIFAGYPFARVIGNSLAVAAGTTALALAAGAPAAFALARLPVRRKRAILALVLATAMFPPIATVSPLFLIVNALGLRDTLSALILTYATFSLPLAVWLLTAFFAELPADLYRAARVDGCTPWQIFARVHLPLAAPGLTATGLVVFIFAWNELLFALTFTATPAARTVPVAIAGFPGLHETPWGEIAAATVVVTLPVVLLALGMQRRLVAGLTAGAVKE